MEKLSLLVDGEELGPLTCQSLVHLAGLGRVNPHATVVIHTSLGDRMLPLERYQEAYRLACARYDPELARQGIPENMGTHVSCRYCHTENFLADQKSFSCRRCGAKMIFNGHWELMTNPGKWRWVTAALAVPAAILIAFGFAEDGRMQGLAVLLLGLASGHAFYLGLRHGVTYGRWGSVFYQATEPGAFAICMGVLAFLSALVTIAGATLLVRGG